MSLMFPKPTPKAVERREKKNAVQAERKRVKTLVQQRDCGRCRITTAFGRHEGVIEVHHCEPLSLLGPDTTANMLCACAFHHSLFKAGTLAVEFLSERGADRLIRLYNPREED